VRDNLESTTYGVSDEKTALADTTVADEQHFEQIVMSIHLIWSRHFLNNKLIIQNLIVHLNIGIDILSIFLD
jgi:hypothetical protein